VSLAASGAPATDLASARRSELDNAWRQFAGAASPEEFCQSWLEVQCQLVGGVQQAMIVLQKPGVETFAPLAYWPEGRRDRAALGELVERALHEGRGVVEPHGSDYRLAYPVRVEGRVRGVVGMEISGRDELQLQAAMRQLQWGAGWLEVLLRRHADPADAARQRLKLVLQLVSAFLMQRDFKDASTALVTELATQLGCDRVVLASNDRGQVHLEAVSHASQFDRHANLLAATAAAMTEALDQREPIVWPAEREGPLVVTHSHAELAQLSGAGGIATFPLVNEERQVGALTLERAHGVRFDAPTLELLEGLAAMLGPLVELQRLRHQSLPALAAQRAVDLRTRLVGPGHGGLKITAAALALVALFLAFADGTYRLAADARIEGEIQRALTAPFQGYVRETGVRAGDTVRQGQLMARLDDRDLRVERARLAAQREQLSQQYRDAMAKQERSQIRMVSAQMAQAEAQAQLVDEQLARTEITAPFDAVVVNGDLTQSLGAPLERGQVLFEVAPLDAYRIVLQVSEQDIADVKVGQGGELALTPMPGQRYPLKVVKITPVSTPKDGRNVFRVEADLAVQPASGAKADLRLRPGMEGVAKIEVAERRLAWIWTRRLVDWLRLKAWAWLP
jgi:RND family efflux transporter MFP subunit